MNSTQTSPAVKTSTVFSLKPVPKIPGVPPIIAGEKLRTDTTIVKPAELVEGWLHRGTKGVLASISKAGKTWLLLLLALCVATGMNFLGRATTRARVLYINFEILPAFIKERLVALMERMGLENCGDLEIWNLRGVTANPEALVAHIIKETEGKDYGLIIIDPTYKLMTGKSENTAGSVGALCHQFDRITEKTGATVMYSQHFTKGNPKKKAAMDRLSGSNVFSRDADSIVTLTPHTEPDCYTVEMILRNFPQQQSFVVQWDYPVMVEREDLDPEDVGFDEVEDEDDHGLLELVKKAPQTNMEWQVKAAALGVSRATFYRTRHKLKDLGLVTFDFKTKTWCFAGGASGETLETPETPETAGPDQVACTPGDGTVAGGGPAQD